MSQSSYNFIAQSKIPSSMGGWLVRAYSSEEKQMEPLAIFHHLNKDEIPLVRIHDACFTSEVLGSLKCDCKEQLDTALKLIKEHGGLVIYLQQEGRGIGLANKIAAYALQDKGLDTVDANRALHLPDDAREYDAAADVLADMGISKIRLLTNNPNKVKKIEDLGIEVVERVAIEISANEHNQGYLQSKKLRMGHYLFKN